MRNAPAEKDADKGDEVLRRLLKTPPDPKRDVGKEKDGDRKPPPEAASKNEG